MEQLLSTRHPIQDLRDIVTIEEAVVSSQSDDFPPPKTIGPNVSKLWKSAFKASTSINYKLDLQSLRFSRAIINNRLNDAQQALIQLKVLQPKNRVLYMAHAAITQLLSTSNEDLQARLAFSLARKAVTDLFDEDKSLDCRVPGQVFAVQGSTKDLEGIRDRPFKDSKQVYDALREHVKPEINGLSKARGSEDPSKVHPLEWLLDEVQSLKRQFAELVESSAGIEAIIAFSANAIRLFNTASTSLLEDRRRVKVDACLLSVSGRVRLFEQSNEQRYLLHAALLAETLLQQDPHIHEARLILVYLYMRLGLGSLALHMFHSLNIKEVQYDTVGHALFTRLSHIHPFSTPLTWSKSVEPFERASHALKFYERCEDKLAENEASVLSSGQTGMIFDLQQLRDSLRSSLSRRIIHIEQRRLSRLVGTRELSAEDISRMGPRKTANWLEVVDNRDFAATFDYGYNVEKVLHGSNGIVSSKNWILFALAADSAWCLASGLATPVIDITKLVEELENVTININRLQIDNTGSCSRGMRDTEYLAGDLACQVLRMLLNLTTSPPELSNDIITVRRSVDRLNIDDLLKTSDAFTEHLVDLYAYTDVLRIVVKACDFINKQTKASSEEVTQVAGLAKDYCAAIQKFAQQRAETINAASIKPLLKQDTEIWDAIKLFGEDDTESFCESVVQSAQDGWQGLPKIKLA